MSELGIAVGAQSIVGHYRDIVDALLIDCRDAAEAVTMPFALEDTLMVTDEDRVRVAHAALALAAGH
jgi:hypothetical protein